MKIGIVTRKNEQKWGGDLAALYTIYEGLKAIDQDVIIGKTVEELQAADFIFLANTSFPLKEDLASIRKYKKRFGIIGFHGDRAQYYNPCYAFANFIGLCIEQQEFPFYTIDQLIENPESIHFFSYAPPPLFEENFPILESAEVCIATSPTEAATMKRDSPGCNPYVVYLDCGIPDSEVLQTRPDFLQWTGLSQGEYVLQIGRIELRKNQLASLIALRDLPMPLVYIATESFYPHYEQMLFKAIAKFRKAPTIVISQNLKSSTQGPLRILQMPRAEKLSSAMLISAYQNAGLHLHPAFCELPGLTYLEAAKLGVPTVASEWTTIRDYFTNHDTQASTLDDRIVYTPPHHIHAMTEQVKKQFGKKIDKTFSHPIFRRTKADVALDLMKALKF